MENLYYPFVNLPLPYAYHALEPFIDEKTMYLHHDKHLQNYIDALNKLLEEPAFAIAFLNAVDPHFRFSSASASLSDKKQRRRRIQPLFVF